MYRRCTVCLDLDKESQAGPVRHSLYMEEDWVYNSPFLFIFFFLQGSSVLALVFMYFNY